ncbi:MAG TPA: hypothetical protein VIT92_07240 [Burkholderiaceae bacterium]
MKTITLLLALLVPLSMAGSAHAEMVVVTGKGAPAVKLEQVCAAFLGKSATPVPVNLPEGNALRDEFFKKACDKDAQQVKATWSKLIFTGKAAAKPKEVASGEDMKKLLAADNALVGYVDRAQLDASLKAVAN